MVSNNNIIQKMFFPNNNSKKYRNQIIFKWINSIRALLTLKIILKLSDYD